MKKVCTKCKRELAVRYFSKDSTRKDKLHPHCKSCRNVYHTPWSRIRGLIPSVGRKRRKQGMKSYVKHREERTKKMRGRTSDYKKESFIKSVYGITLKDYDNMLKNQKGVCAICGEKETRKNRYTGICRLHIDHDHKTGKVRGLLCHACNFGIAAFNDNSILFDKAKEYLAQRIGGD
jgi:hypothetical protein